MAQPADLIAFLELDACFGIRDVAGDFADLDADIILITEKDAVKCVRTEAIASDSRLWVVPVQAAIDGPLSKHLVENLRGYPTG